MMQIMRMVRAVAPKWAFNATWAREEADRLVLLVDEDGRPRTEHGQRPSELLVELAETAGLPRIEFAAAFDSAEQHAATAADFTWVQDLGIAGFPTLLAERQGQLALLTNGYQPLEPLSDLLGRWLDRAASA